MNDGNNQWNRDIEKLTEEELWEHYLFCLSRHDWYYTYSDDHRYWVAGTETEKVLNNVKAKCKALDEIKTTNLFNEYCPWMKDAK